MPVSTDEMQEYLIARKVHEAIRHYFVYWVVPVVSALVLLIGYFGLQLRDLDNAVQANAHLETRLQFQKNEVDRLAVQVKEAAAEVGATLEQVLGRVDSARQAADTARDKLTGTMLSQGVAIAEIRASVEHARRNLSETERVADSVASSLLEQELAGVAAMDRFREAISRQDQVIAAHVVDSVTLRSNGRATVRLPLEMGKFVALYISVGNIKSDTLVSYQVGTGPVRQFMLDSEQKSEYRPVPLMDVGGLYEIQPDIVFYSPGSKVRDFLGLRIKRTERMLFDRAIAPPSHAALPLEPGERNDF